MDERGKLVRLPMKYVEGQWVLEYGGDLPVRHGAIGDLRVEADLIGESLEKSLFLREEQFQILPEGTPLRVIVEVRDPASISQEQARVLMPWEEVRPNHSPIPLPGPSRYSRMIEVLVDRPTNRQFTDRNATTGGLWLKTQGVAPIGLVSSTIRLPSCVATEPAQSLNHAYTRLSEVFETWRRSHTGSVYRRVLYQESDGAWYPLRLLRDSHVAQQSHRIAQDLWKQIMARYAPQVA